MHSVYIHTVLKNNKKYIGQCVGDPHKRWGATGHRYKGQLFYYAIEKYGWENIRHEIIADDLTLEEANQLEKKLIEEYHTTDRKFGYNIALGGKDGAGMPGCKNHNAKPVVCLETGQEWECANYCAKDLGVNCASLQESLYNGYKCKGFHFKYLNDDNYMPNREPYMVECIETGKVWKNVKECSKELGVNSRTIARYCEGIRKPKNGLTYKYVA